MKEVKILVLPSLRNKFNQLSVLKIVKFILTVLLSLTIFLSFAQNPENKKDWLPVFENSLPTRFFTVKMEGLFQYSINSTSEIEEIGDGSAEISGNRLSSISLKFPILSKPNVVLTGGAKYTDEQFYFSEFDPVDYPLYVSLNDRNLKNLGGDINGLFHLKGNRSILLRSSFYLAGDFYRSDKYFSIGNLLKTSVALGYGVKKDKNTYIAGGVYFGYTFGRPSFFPVLVYSKRFNNGFGLEAALPQSIRIWKKVSDKFFVIGHSKISGNSYTMRLQGSILEEAESLQLRQSNIVTSIGIYWKLGKWIWLESEAGYSHNLNFNISESNFIPGSTLPKPDTDYLIKSDVSGAPFLSLSMFLAPPREFLDKFIK